ncbi:HAD family hydrolase [Anaerotruncus massiliensis (ex Togo et al. 2019)]|uniref:HAD family hydrolase n=1 Tax=Anaerotruncus TaxID=244127 RepID=UPI00155249E8|nr:HAD family hydrolase [Anaerotruncus massiliensis (ex Togo et al. 2019)]
MRKMLALDLDGTTFGVRTQLSEANRRALLAAKRAGTAVCFVTGRKSVEPISHLCALADYFVLNNGGTVVAAPDMEQLYTTLVERSDMLRLIDFCLSQDSAILHLISGDYWGVNRITPGVLRQREEFEGTPVVYRGADDLPFETLDGFVVSENYGPVREFIERKGLRLTCAVTNATSMDVMPEGVNKWRGTAYVAAREGIAHENIVAAGNYYNDLELIRGAGVGVAVRNAPEEVRAQADYVTARTHLEDAVAEIVEKFIL